MRFTMPNKCAAPLAIVIVLATVIAVTTAIFLRKEVRVIRLPDGRVIKLEGYAFQRGAIRYELPNRPVLSRFAKLLPGSVTKKAKWLRPEMTVVLTSHFSNEPMLSAAFALRDSSGKPSSAGSRLAVSDDREQMFDSVVNYLGNQGVFQARAFPRRGSVLRLRLMDGDSLLAEFKIPNPCPGPHAVWKDQAPTVVVTNGSLEITLESFTADAVRLRTQCTFRVRDNGVDSTAWLPESFEVSDATGNHWRPAVDSAVRALHGTLITGGFFGALWPEEDAWRLRVEFKSVAKIFADETTRIVEFLAKPVQAADGPKSQSSAARIKAPDR